MNSSLEKEIKRKRSLFRQYKRTSTPACRQAFNEQRNRVTKLLRKAERAHVLKLYRDSKSATSSTSQPSFWDFMQSLSGSTHRSPIPDLHDEHGTFTSAREKAAALNSFFVRQTHLIGSHSTPDVSSLPINEEVFSQLSTTPADVFRVLSSLPRRKAPGMDGVTTHLLKECASGIAVSLSDLFNRSFAEQRFPAAWKDALVVPAFKRGDRSSLTNYRPIALLSSVGKVCERIVYNKLDRFFSTYLSDQQSGFRQQDGTSLQLVRLVQQWSDALNDSQHVGIVFFDLRKAFDRVWHRGLLAKLYASGVRGPAFAWFESYLSGRRQRTRVAEAVSDPESLFAGVPQGAILSPLLFIIYVNDITNATSASVNLFADDTSSFLTDSDPARLCVRLQAAVDSLAAWFDQWLLSVNVEKSAVLALRQPRSQQVDLPILLNGSCIPQVSSHRHLGVTINDTLTWSDHVQAVISKAARRIGLLRRYRKRLPPLSIRHVYCSSIRPVLEYASIVWSGLSTIAARNLESLQRKAARLITGILPSSDISHDILLARAGLPTLSSRRQLEQAVFGFKFAHSSHLPDHLIDHLQHWKPAKPSRAASLRNAQHIRLPRVKKSVLQHSPLYLSLSAFNALSPDLQNAPSAASLRKSLSSSL